ncbi:hypothetical protein NMY22_g15551 [Coprinellus aureogranulatus]|nr:hypothetical protein NMY22_g15551 [Coprinellus aureogranulatus]
MNSSHKDLSGHHQHTQPTIQRSPSPLVSDSAEPVPNQDATPLDPDIHLGEAAAATAPNDPPRPQPRKILHPYLTGAICNAFGQTLPPGSHTPPPLSERANDDFTPFEDATHFCIADFLYRREEMSQTNINTLLHLWGLTLMKHGATFGPFDNYTHLFNTIDNIEQGDAPWQCLQVELQEDIDENSPSWKYHICTVCGPIWPILCSFCAKTAGLRVRVATGEGTGGYAATRGLPVPITSWKKKPYEVWFRDPDTVLANMLANPDFNGEFDYQPYVEVDRDGKRRWSDFMSGNHAWTQSEKIFRENDANRGATYVPIILGSDKTTVSVATGDIEYHPLYLSIGNVHNNVRRAHRNAVVPIAFLAIPKGDRKSDDDADFRRFKQQLYHATIAAVFQGIKSHFTTPVVRRCPDGHFRRVIFDFGAFIADYPEQVMLAGVVQGWCPKCTAQPSNIDGSSGPRTNSHLDELLARETMNYTTLWEEYGVNSSIIPFTRDFPRAEIYKIISSDLLHQVIKGTFKDHLVTWVEEYLFATHEKAEANTIMDEIDRRLAAVPPFSGLRRFKQGRRFKQWTGDDSKALMKIYLSSIQGLLPREVIKCFAAFLDLCYLVRRNDIDSDTLTKIQKALQRFHTHREFFRRTGVREEGFSLPRQHSLVHYCDNIRNFGAPNGLCSSITESRHITAVKKPWRRSNRYEALGQMLLINQRLDKLAAGRSHFAARGMLPPERLKLLDPLENSTTVQVRAGLEEGERDEDEGGAINERVLADVRLSRTRDHVFASATETAEALQIPSLPYLLENFLHEQLGTTPEDEDEDWEDDCILDFISPISTFRSAVATFFAPSDLCGVRGMRREWLRCTPNWRKTGPRRDCVYLVQDDTKPGFRGLNVVRLKALLSFSYEGTDYPCAVVEWFKKVGRSPDPDTGMWIVQPDMSSGERDTTIVHLDSILRAAHLLPLYGSSYPLIPSDFEHTRSLDSFNAFYVNKYIDHHAHEVAF